MNVAPLLAPPEHLGIAWLPGLGFRPVVTACLPDPDAWPRCYQRPGDDAPLAKWDGPARSDAGQGVVDAVYASARRAHASGEAIVVDGGASLPPVAPVPLPSAALLLAAALLAVVALRLPRGTV